MLPLSQIENKQIPLIHIVHEDDAVLLNTPEADWFRALYYFHWEKYRIFCVFRLSKEGFSLENLCFSSYINYFLETRRLILERISGRFIPEWLE